MFGTSPRIYGTKSQLNTTCVPSSIHRCHRQVQTLQCSTPDGYQQSRNRQYHGNVGQRIHITFNTPGISYRHWAQCLTLHNIDGLVQDCRSSIANALELLQSFIKPPISPDEGNPCDMYSPTYVIKESSVICSTHAFTCLFLSPNQRYGSWMSKLIPNTTRFACLFVSYKSTYCMND